jgi:putative CocE/NonD family hydrolase
MSPLDTADLVDEVETAWIPLSDGRRLAARLFLPRSARRERVPVVLEYIPYRRRDGTRIGDEAMHRWFAAHGYASVRVDIAGTGDSDGLLDDEYVRREQDDGLEVIAWLAGRSWSTGAVGMIGISWGGFNGLQLAACRPPALRAVISCCSTVDRYRCDAHYTGGCLNEENLEWGAHLFTMHALPPDPAVVGLEHWRRIWRDRIDAARLAPADWLHHQRRDEFWRHGSVVEDLAAIQVPVLAVSGWADGYTETVFDLVEGLGGLARGIVGPWGHKYPHEGVPGPAIGFLQEATRWWDRWLRGADRADSPDPAMRLWVQDSLPPRAHHDERPGRWVAFDRWPSRAVVSERWIVSGGSLCPDRGTSPATGAVRTVRSPQTVGLAGGQWCAYGLGKIAPELPLDQRGDDAGSLVVDSDVLEQPLVLAGRPTLEIRVSSDRPDAFVAVRLNDVHPDGTSERVSYGILNLAHRNGHASPEPLVPGEPVTVEIELKELAHAVPAGHRLRLALSTSYWPMIWPSPRPATLSVHDAETVLELPVLVDLAGTTPCSFDVAASAASGSVTQIEPGGDQRTVTHDLGTGRTEVAVSRDDGRWVVDDVGTEQTYTRVRTTTITDDDPASARAHLAIRASYRRGDWSVRIHTDIAVSCDRHEFRIEAVLRTMDGDTVFAERRFDERVPRDHM